MGFVLCFVLFCAVDIVSVVTTAHIPNGTVFTEAGPIIPEKLSEASPSLLKNTSITSQLINVTTTSKELLRNSSISPLPLTNNITHTIQEPPLLKTSNNISISSTVSPPSPSSKSSGSSSNSTGTTTSTSTTSTTTKTSSTTTTSTTTTTTTPKPIPKKPLIAKAAIEVFPESVLNRKLNVTFASSSPSSTSTVKLNDVTQESDKVPPPVVEESIEKDSVSTSPQFVRYSGFSDANRPGFIIPLVITIFTIPLLGFFTYHALKKGREAWQNRHYHRMDFLIDGMYND